MNVIDRLLAADRTSALRFMSAAVHELTIVARASYDCAEAPDQLMRTNEAIHRLSGHLRDLCDPEEPLTTGRAEGIAAQAELVSKHGMARLLGYLPT